MYMLDFADASISLAAGLESEPFEPFIILEDDVSPTAFGACFVQLPEGLAGIAIPSDTDGLFLGLWAHGGFVESYISIAPLASR